MTAAPGPRSSRPRSEAKYGPQRGTTYLIHIDPPINSDPNYEVFWEDRKKGFFVSFDYTSDAMTEISRFFKQSGRVIIPLTVQEILDDQIAMKLA